MKKRSIIVSGHSTSISIEDEFWSALSEIAQEKKSSITSLISEIDQKRTTPNLSSAIRLFVLQHLRSKKI